MTRLRIPDQLLRPRTTFLVMLSAVASMLTVAAADKPPAKPGAAKLTRPGQMTAPAPAAPKKKIDKLAVLAKFREEMPTYKYASSHTVEFSPQELDRMLLNELGKRAADVAPEIDDERFIRRVYLDTTGRLPEPKEISEFVADDYAKKRTRLIDRLLESGSFARHWARYWRNVMLYNSEVPAKKISPQALEDWLAGEFHKDIGWDVITANLLAADGKNPENGPDNFLIAQEGKPERMAAETARVFMGINIQCAECHNHPFDKWKREQFHELAAFFSSGKYYMPDLQHPDKKTEMHPKFLLGETPKGKLGADEKRIAVAAYLIYNRNNYWFARAFVNRVWHELFGDAFYAVDSLGPDNDVHYKLVVNRLASVFRYKEFKLRWLFRTLLNSQAYQRDIRNPKSESDRFASVRPTRLEGIEVAEAVDQVLGATAAADQINRTFSFDPSLPQQDVDGSIQQALLLMNQPGVQKQIQQGPLTKRLQGIKDDSQLVRELYLAVLARNPTAQETSRSLQYLKMTPRREAIEDLVWVLVNSAEFKTKR